MERFTMVSRLKEKTMNVTAKKTLDFQSTLPSLPVPTLEETCDRYLESVQPFLSKRQYEETKQKTLGFQSGVGKQLQTKLELFASNSRNWLQDYWYDSYVDYRGPSPMISNISGGYEPFYEYDKAVKGSSIHRGAQWIHAMTQIYQRVLRQEIPVQLLGRQFPMDMTQYCSFFCGGRVPGEKRDTQVHYVHTLPKPDGTMEIIANIKHFIILMRGRVFCIQVIDEEGKIMHPETIERTIEEIKEICERDGDGEGVAALTMGQRETWYKAYKHLCRLDRQNKIYVNLVNQAICGLAFEDVDTYGLQDSSTHGILGGGVNRWFDKTCCAVCSNTGLIVSTEDHIHFDGNVGVAILQLVADVLHEHKGDIKVDYNPQKVQPPLELKFIVDDHIRSIVKENVKKHEMLSSALHCIDKPIEGYGKAFGKMVRINPDTIVQMALQLAYYSLHRKVVPTYESATTRMFYNGRTETVRSCTNETKAWCEAMFDTSKSPVERKDLFWKAVEKHDTLMRDACQGKGIDRHLFILKKLSEEEGLPLPEIFQDKGYKLSGGDANFTLSTSLSGFTVLHGGMSPMIEDGYGTFYNINKDRLQICVSAWKTSSVTDCQKFYDAIVTSFHTIRKICEKPSSKL